MQRSQRTPLARTAVLALVGLLMFHAAPLVAQATLRGVLHDSLRTNKPIADAEVVLLGANRRAITDENGRFEFAGVAAGTATVAFAAPWLDSLALPPLQVAVTVGGAGISTVLLATPSRLAYQRAVCGTALGETEGILIGDLRTPEGELAAGIPVGARWYETRIGTGQFERVVRASLDSANANGFYTLCGVPTDAEVALVAATDSVASGDVIVGLNGMPVARRDLTVAPHALLTRVRGRLLGPDEKGLAGAVVALSGDSTRRARTDDEGRFVIVDVPRRSGQLVARALGFVPSLVAVEPLGDDTELEDVALQRIPQELAAVNVTGQAMTAAQLQFETRRARGIGFFVSDSALSKFAVVNSTIVGSMIPRTNIRQTRQGPMLYLRRGSEWCRPRFFLEGYDNGDLSAEEENSAMARAKRVEVYTASNSPPQFNDFNGCGAVVIWSR